MQNLNGLLEMCHRSSYEVSIIKNGSSGMIQSYRYNWNQLRGTSNLGELFMLPSDIEYITEVQGLWMKTHFCLGFSSIFTKFDFSTNSRSVMCAERAIS